MQQQEGMQINSLTPPKRWREEGMKLLYKLSKEPDKDTLDGLEDSRKAFQSLIVNGAKVLKPGFITTSIAWIFTRFYRRKITQEENVWNVEYEFPFIT